MPNSYLDFDLEIGKGKDGIYAIQARWQGNEAWQEAQLANQPDLTALRQAIEEAVYHSPLRRRKRTGTNHEAIVQSLGQQLFDFALSGEVLAQLRACQRAAKSQHKEGVRLRLRIFDPELAGLPWEYLYDSRLRDFIALDPTLPMVRYLHHPHAVPPTTLAAPLRILAMVASPINLPALDVAVEKQRVEQAVANLQAAGRIELHWLPGETALDLQSALRKGPWHIFRFIGHGDFDPLRDEGYLVLCNARNRQAEPIYATQLARLLGAQSNHLRFVLLNACDSGRGSSSDIFSSTAETLINRDLPAVLAMQYSITDDAATLFAQHLYESLADGLPIDRSVAEARNALALADSQNLEWGVPVLHMRSPDGVLFEVGEALQSSKVAEGQSEKRVAASGTPLGAVTEDKAATRSQSASAPPVEPAQPKPKPKWQEIGIEMVKIPAGDFLYGEDKRKVNLPEFWMAKTPVTNQQYKAFVDATGQAAPRHWSDGKIPAAKANHPVVYVSWEDAQAFCKWAGGQLPSEQQWEKAARGTDGRTYPWGEEKPDRTRCNFNMNEKGTTAVGKYPVGANGLLDMAGNVWEWCEDWFDERKQGRLLRGGSFNRNEDFVRCACRNNGDPDYRFDNVGFRLLLPGSASLSSSVL